MTDSELTLVVSAGSALAAVMGLIVAFAALRLSAASVPLDFRLRLNEEATVLGYPRDPGYWVRGLLINAGASCRVSTFRVIDWDAPAFLPSDQAPYTAQRSDRKTYPRPERQWNRWRRMGISIVRKHDARTEGLFYPRVMPTGTDSGVHVWMPPTVKSVEFAVGVSNRFSAPRSHNFWIENPLFDQRTGKSDD